MKEILYYLEFFSNGLEGMHLNKFLSYSDLHETYEKVFNIF